MDDPIAQRVQMFHTAKPLTKDIQNKQILHYCNIIIIFITYTNNATQQVQRFDCSKSVLSRTNHIHHQSCQKEIQKIINLSYHRINCKIQMIKRPKHQNFLPIRRVS